MLKLLSVTACGLLLSACAAYAVDTAAANNLVDTAPIAGVGLYQQHCSICHLDAGQGVPGAFPSLDQRLAGWSRSEAGQTYLASVVANGLSGVLLVDGQQYAGAMPGLAAQLTNAEMAGLLNYVLTEFAGGSAVFTKDSVAKQLAAVGAGPSLRLRPE